MMTKGEDEYHGGQEGLGGGGGKGGDFGSLKMNVIGSIISQLQFNHTTSQKMVKTEQ